MPQPRLTPHPLNRILSPSYRSLPLKTRLSLAGDLLEHHAATYGQSIKIFGDAHRVLVAKRKTTRRFVDAVACSRLPRVVKAGFLKSSTDLVARFLDFEIHYCTSPQGTEFDLRKLTDFTTHVQQAHEISKAVEPPDLVVIARAIKTAGVHRVRHAFGAVRRGGHGHLIRLLSDLQ